MRRLTPALALALSCSSAGPDDAAAVCSEDAAHRILEDPQRLEEVGAELELSDEEVVLVATFWVYTAALEQGRLPPAQVDRYIEAIVPAVQELVPAPLLGCGTQEWDGSDAADDRGATAGTSTVAKTAPDPAQCPDPSYKTQLTLTLLNGPTRTAASAAVASSTEGAAAIGAAAELANGAHSLAMDQDTASTIVSTVAGVVGAVGTGAVAAAAAATTVFTAGFDYGVCQVNEERYCDHDGDGQTVEGGDCDDQDGRNLFRLQRETAWDIGERECEEGRDLDCSGDPPPPEECTQYVDADGDGYSRAAGDCDDASYWTHPYSGLSSDDRDLLDWWECTYDTDYDCSGSLPSDDRCACELGYNAPEGVMPPPSWTWTGAVSFSGDGRSVSGSSSYTYQDEDEDGAYGPGDTCTETGSGWVTWYFWPNVTDPDGGWLTHEVTRVSGSGSITHDSSSSSPFAVTIDFDPPGCSGTDTYEAVVRYTVTDCAGQSGYVDIDLELTVRGPDA